MLEEHKQITKVIQKTVMYCILNKLTRRVIDNMGSLNGVEDRVKTVTVFDEIKASVSKGE